MIILTALIVSAFFKIHCERKRITEHEEEELLLNKVQLRRKNPACRPLITENT